jgi:hypothetical protein
MASTRNKNTPGDYKLEKQQNINVINYNTYLSYGVPMATYYSGDGLLGGRIASENLSGNSCDIESMLRGIGATNLETPLPTLTPELKSIKSLSIIDRLPVYVPRTLVVDPNQRPHHE